MPSWKTFKNGKNIVLTTKDSTMDAFIASREDDGTCLLKAAIIIRQDRLAYSIKSLITVPKNILFPKAYLSYSE